MRTRSFSDPATASCLRRWDGSVRKFRFPNSHATWNRKDRLQRAGHSSRCAPCTGGRQELVPKASRGRQLPRQPVSLTPVCEGHTAGSWRALRGLRDAVVFRQTPLRRARSSVSRLPSAPPPSSLQRGPLESRGHVMRTPAHSHVERERERWGRFKQTPLSPKHLHVCHLFK